MKLLYIMDRFPLYRQVYIHNEIKEILKLGHKIHLVSFLEYPDTNNLLSELGPNFSLTQCHVDKISKDSDISHISQEIKNLCQENDGLDNVRAIVLDKVVKILKDNSFDLIHAHAEDDSVPIANIVSKVCNVPFTYSMHTSSVLTQNPKKYVEWSRNASAIIAISEFSRELAKDKFQADSNKIFLVPSSLDFNFLSKIQKTQTNDIPTILAVGALSEKKGIRYLIESFSQLQKENVRFNGMIIGDGNLREELSEMISEMGLGACVRMLGALPYTQTVQEIANANIVAVPSIIDENGDHDVLPNVIKEALYFNIPVIATNLPSFDEIANITLAPPKNSTELAIAIKNQIKVGVSEHDSINLVGRFSAKTNTKKLVEIFTSLI